MRRTPYSRAYHSEYAIIASRNAEISRFLDSILYGVLVNGDGVSPTGTTGDGWSYGSFWYEDPGWQQE